MFIENKKDATNYPLLNTNSQSNSLYKTNPIFRGLENSTNKIPINQDFTL